MKHTQCGGVIEIRTDPKNTAYVVVEGGRKRDTGEDKEGGGVGVGEIALKTRTPGAGAGAGDTGTDPFARLEGKVEDKRVFDTERNRILELQSRQDRDWDDPYEKSRRLRKRFRTERKGLEAADAGREALKDKMSLGIELVDETEEDRVRAGMVDFHPETEVDVEGGSSRATRMRPMFESRISSSAGESKKITKGKPGQRQTADLLAQRKETLRNELAGNTRAVVDPFLNEGSAWRPGIKKRKTTKSADEGSPNPAERNQRDASLPPVDIPASTPALVGYASDSE